MVAVPPGGLCHNCRMSDSRVIDAAEIPAEQAVEASVRPRTLAEYVGQAAMREQLSLSIEAAKKRGDALDHVLVFGPPGLRPA